MRFFDENLSVCCVTVQKRDVWEDGDRWTGNS